MIQYDIDALVAREDTVAAVWTCPLPNGSDYRGLSLYLVIDGKVAETSLTDLIGPRPA